MKKSIKDPVTPTPASTVILTREYHGELQVYLLKRSTSSGFQAGNYVFPGGRVDPQDRDSGLWLPHVDMDPKGISGRLGESLTWEEALGYAVSAIRETFEEAGVFLAHRGKRAGGNLDSIRERRVTGKLPEGWFNEEVVSGGWILELSGLARWSHWITPVVRRQRYDTRFFSVFLPPGQECSPDTRETTYGIWLNPREGVERNLRGEIHLSLPTFVTLHELLEYSNLEDLAKAVETRPWGEARTPKLIMVSKVPLVLLPWDPLYHEEFDVDETELEMRPLDVGEPFSRIKNHKGIWMPVK